MNKILGAILGTCLALLTLNIAAGAIFAPAQAGQAGLRDRGAGRSRATAERRPAEPEQPIEQLLAKADVGRGENSAKKCAACHTFNKGGRNLVGPNLWGIVGRPKASEAGFNYSAAIKAKGGNWTIEDLNQFIINPKGMVPGTNMTFAGIPRGERARRPARLSSTPCPTIPRRCRQAAEAPGAPKAAVTATIAGSGPPAHAGRYAYDLRRSLPRKRDAFCRLW